MTIVYHVQVQIYRMQGQRPELRWEYVSAFDGRGCKYAYDRKDALKLNEAEYNRLVDRLELRGETFRTEEFYYD